MQAAYYQTPELTLLTCSKECHERGAATYAARGYVPYLGNDGAPLIESDAATRELIARGELPESTHCDVCRARVDSRESWSESRGWHVCHAVIKSCSFCARVNVWSWRVNGICERCDGGPPLVCCDGPAID